MSLRNRGEGAIGGVTRRRLLQSGIALGGTTLLFGGGCAAPDGEARGAPGRGLASGDWARNARLANASFGEAPDDSELRAMLDQLVAEKVSVIETDTQLSQWLTDAQFAAAMADARRWNDMVHAAGLKVVWYYPSLEVISAGGETGPSMYKTHPDWAQVGIDGRPNVFYGSLVFWVDPGDESVWLSPNSPWRKVYLDRVKLLAATGTDGIWPDVPIYFNGRTSWCDTSPWARRAFLAATGLDIPTAADFTNPVWRRFIEWRHRNLAQFQIDIAAAARSINPGCCTIVETVTCDYADGTAIGLDGAWLRRDPSVAQVWEVDVCSNATAMRMATATDWICLIAMVKYGKAASGNKPSWCFSYGQREDDASLVMAELLAAGCNPYEVQAPTKEQGVGGTMRRRLYAFIEAHTDELFGAVSLAQVAVYHSSASRDYVAPSEANGMYFTAIPPDGDTDNWWSSGDTAQSCAQKQWLGEYRGAIKALVHAHVPWNVLTSPDFEADDLAGYRALVLPDLEAVSDHEASILREFVRGGGTVVITGPNPTGWNQFGDLRADYALADLLNFHQGGPVPSSVDNAFGAGRLVFYRDFPGTNYLRNGLQADRRRIVDPLVAAAPPPVTVDADPRVHLELTQRGADTLLHFTNFIGVTGVFSTAPTRFNAQLRLPPGRRVTAVRTCSPDQASPGWSALAFTITGDQIAFAVDVIQYTLVAVTLG